MKFIRHWKTGVYCKQDGYTIYLDFCTKNVINRLLLNDVNDSIDYVNAYIICGEFDFVDEYDIFVVNPLERDDYAIWHITSDKKVEEKIKCKKFLGYNVSGHYAINKSFDRYSFQNKSHEEAFMLMVETAVEDFLKTHIVYYGALLEVASFCDMPCLWIDDDVRHRSLPHMECVGGHPDECCVFLSNITESDIEHMSYFNNKPVTMLDIQKIMNK